MRAVGMPTRMVVAYAVNDHAAAYRRWRLALDEASRLRARTSLDAAAVKVARTVADAIDLGALPPDEAREVARYLDQHLESSR